MKNLKEFYSKRIKRIYHDSGSSDSELLARIKSLLPDKVYLCVDNPSAIPAENRNEFTLWISQDRGKMLKHCPATPEMDCCNYLTIDLYEGCTLGCSYCIMQNYLNFSPVSIRSDITQIAQKIKIEALAHQDQILRIGTGETGDSLLFDPLTELSPRLVEAAAQHENVYLELKTKTNFVDHLLDLEPKGNAVIGFSVNPPTIAENEDGWSASIDDRLKAAKKVLDAGYRVAFHFDPIIPSKDWQDLYADFLEEFIALLRSFLDDYPQKPDSLPAVAWVSLGILRFPPALTEKMPSRPYLLDEFILGEDGKRRYHQSERIEIFSFIKEYFEQVPEVLLYLCMESETVWKKVFGARPGEIKKLAPIFTDIMLE
jgi:spore photoproduct lyase